MEEVKLNVTTDKDGVAIIRIGDALKQDHPKPINLTGTLQAPYQYYEGKKDDCKPLECHIIIEKDKGTLTFVQDDKHPFSRSTVKGCLSKDNVLSTFAINTDKKWGVQEFLKFIKTMRYYFADPAQHRKLIESLQKWQVKVERVIKEHNDQRGNSDFQLQTKVQQSADGSDGLVSSFDLDIAIFQGYPKVKFKVEIGLDPRNSTVELFLISDELIELEIKERESHIAEELQKFSDFACSKIVIS